MIWPLFVALLFSVQLFLLPFSSPTLAAPRVTTTDPPEDLASAGVSLVRLLVSYTNTTTHPASTFQCTGLGVLVDNWSSTATQLNTSVLTDGNLLSTHGGTTCVPGVPATVSLKSVQLFFSNLYNNTGITSPLLSGNSFAVVCEDTTTCSNGMALLSFHSPASFPLVDVSQAKETLTGFGLALTETTGSPIIPAQPTDAAQSMQLTNQVPLFLTPHHLPLNGGGFQGESGAPLVDAQGQLLGIHLSKNEDSTNQGTIDFLQQEHVRTHPDTSLQQSWRTGVIKYYDMPKDPSAAKTAFQAAFAANPEFLAANDFVSRASVSGSNTNGNGGKTPVGTAVATSGASKPAFELPGFLSDHVKWGPVSFPFWLLIVAAILVLLALLAVILLLVTAIRRRQEYLAAERKAAIDAQRIAAQEAEPQPAPAKSWLEQQPTLPMQQSPALLSAAQVRTGQLSRPDMRCPRCGEPVPVDANYCTNCRLLLSPTESGLHLRVKPTTAPQPIVLPPSPAAASVFQPTLQAQPIQTSQLSPVRPSSITDHPTIEMPPPEVVMNGSRDLEQSSSVLQMQGYRLGFAVGTHSDPGIKRKLKPNEDSLFAAQGPRSPSSTGQPPFGLFVIADGMGGHANGQDASRRAIQNLIDYMLPRLMKSADASPDAFQTLLQEGVQQANQAVHQHNVELRADMGTTITAALVVDTTSYICNVGDSRTYLYREGEGLRKVTNDHSVVASLVEAGIIKPDDIYTHPKRNQIYRSLGEKSNVEVDSFQVALLPGDKLLLCSDGLWDMVRDPKIEDVIKSPLPDPNQTASALITAALEGGGEDNVSVIVISVTDNPQYGMSTDFRLIAKPDTVQVPPM